MGKVRPAWVACAIALAIGGSALSGCQYNYFYYGSSATENSYSSSAAEDDDRIEEMAYATCFPEASSLGGLTAVEGETYIASYRAALDGSGDEIGRCYKTKSTAVSVYGNLAAIIGIASDGSVARVAIIENTQTIPGSTDQYAEFINAGGHYLDVPSYIGGTVGVNILHLMIAEAVRLTTVMLAQPTISSLTVRP